MPIRFVRQTDEGRYGELKKTIINDYLRGGPDSLKTLEEAVTLFKHYIPTAAEKQSQKRAATQPSNNKEVAFSQRAGSIPDSRACYSCGEFGHLVRDCRKAKNEDKVAIFRKGDASWRASRTNKSTAPQAPSSASSNDNKMTAASNPDPGFINIEAGGDEVSVLSQRSFAQYAQYESFLASSNGTEIQDLQGFGIMEYDDDCSNSIDLDEFTFFSQDVTLHHMLPF